jgi:uncharacterized protein YlxP (DUF503 family)
MQVGSCVITLRLYGVASLKDKRSIVKSLLARLPDRYNVAAAEVAAQDSWQDAVIGVVTVANDAAIVHSTLERAVAWIEQHTPDASVEAYAIEML